MFPLVLTTIGEPGNTGDGGDGYVTWSTTEVSFTVSFEVVPGLLLPKMKKHSYGCPTNVGELQPLETLTPYVTSAPADPIESRPTAIAASPQSSVTRRKLSALIMSPLLAPVP